MRNSHFHVSHICTVEDITTQTQCNPNTHIHQENKEGGSRRRSGGSVGFTKVVCWFDEGASRQYKPWAPTQNSSNIATGMQCMQCAMALCKHPPWGREKTARKKEHLASPTSRSQTPPLARHKLPIWDWKIVHDASVVGCPRLVWLSN